MGPIRTRSESTTKTFHGWPYILKAPGMLSPQDKRKMTKKRRG